MNKLEKLTKNHAAYLKALEELQHAEREAKSIKNNVDNRINDERGADAMVIADLEKRLYNTPREELRRITEQINNAKPETDTQYWVNYYRKATGALHDNEVEKLKKRSEALKNNIALIPFSDEERELHDLRSKRYNLTPAEYDSVSEAVEELERKYLAVKTAIANLRESFSAVKCELERVNEDINGAAAGKRYKDYNSIITELKLMR